MTPLERAWRGGRNDWRLHALSVFSVAVAFICMASALLVVVNIDALRNAWARSGRTSVYLKARTTESQVRELEAALKASPAIKATRYVSEEEARREVLGATDDAILAKLPTQAFPASIELDIEGGPESPAVKAVLTSLSALPQVEVVQTYEAWTDRLGRLLAGGVTAAVLLATVVFGAVVSVVASTMRLTLQRRRLEVEVLKLVGATDEYVRRPFVIEGAAQGALGATLATLMLGALFLIVRSHFDGELALLIGASPAFLPWQCIALMVGTGGALGAGAAYLSLRKLLAV